MRIYVSLALCLLCATGALAQGSIKGKLIDSAAKKPLGFATVTVFKASDTSIITYRLTNPDGEFRVPGLPLNVNLRAVVSYSGFEAFRYEFTLPNDAALDLGEIQMTASSRSLDEVLVVAERPPVTVKKDTIEFNASSFKTLPTALVEDLLRKLPGVQVDGEGNITANGRKVNRILVDGKSFFGDDPKMATKNLPANAIDKIQVTEDKDEANRNTTGDLANTGQVINLTLKKGIKKGWFGKLYGGGGTNERYEVGGIANIYRDTMQLSVLAFSNNVNRSGFSMKEVQDMGGFNRSGYNSMMVTTRGGQTGFALNGISFGGIEPGIARTSGLGFNLNHAPSKRKSFFLQYFLGNTKTYVEQTNNTQQFFNDTILNNRTISRTDRNQISHNLGAGMNLKPDSVTDITFRANYSYVPIDEDVAANVRVENNKTGLLSRGNGLQLNNFYSNRYNHNFNLTKRSRTKKGRSLNVWNNVNFNKSLQRYITESINDYFFPTTRQQIFNQLRRQEVPGFVISTSASVVEPLTKKLSLRVTGRHEYLEDQQDIGIYDKDIMSSKYELINYAKSSGFTRNQNRFSGYGGIVITIKDLTINAGVTANYQHIENSFKNISQPVNFNIFKVLPSATLNYKQFYGSYSMFVSAPSVNYLIPVPDSTNPFYIRYGNPYLKPVRQHSFYLSNFNFFQGSGASYNFYVNGSINDNDVVMSRTIDANGVQTDKPVNANGTANLYAGFGFGKEFKNKQNFIFSFRISPYINFNRRKIIVNNNSSTASTWQYGPSFSVNLNWNDKIEFRPQYNPGFSSTKYTDPAFTNIKVKTQSLESELIVRLPKKLVWETNLAYRYTTQVAPGLPKTNVLWNAAVTLLMLKGDVGLLKLSVFDILDRNNGFYRYTTQNQIVDNETNVLQRYGLLSFTYNIRNLGAPKKVGGKDRLFLF